MNKLKVKRTAQILTASEGELFEDPSGIVWVVAHEEGGANANPALARRWEIASFDGRSRRWASCAELTTFLQRNGYVKLLPGDSVTVEVK